MKTFKPIGGDKMKTALIIFVLGLIPIISFANLNLNSGKLEHNVYSEILEMEDWMLTPKSWSTIDRVGAEIQESLVLEDWMLDLDNKSWGSEETGSILIEDQLSFSKDSVEAEADMEVEDWMINPSDWNTF